MDELKESLDRFCSYPGTCPWVEAFGFPESEWIWFRKSVFLWDNPCRVGWPGTVVATTPSVVRVPDSASRPTAGGETRGAGQSTALVSVCLVYVGTGILNTAFDCDLDTMVTPHYRKLKKTSSQADSQTQLYPPTEDPEGEQGSGLA